MTNFLLHYSKSLLCSSLLVTLLCGSASGQQAYSKICDASAAVSIDAAHFIVAEDEGDKLYIYRNDSFALEKGIASPLSEFDFSSELHVDGGRESDIEGATKIDGRAFWITSHGRNKKGKLRKNRYKLFATDIVDAFPTPNLVFSGSYVRLVEDLIEQENWSLPNAEATLKIIAILKASTQLNKKKVPDLAPKEDGLNIEALAATPDKLGLLIGLRNPVPDGNALIVPLLNVNKLLSGAAVAAKFGQPILLDLGGLGIRSMEYVPSISAFFIIAGPVDSDGPFELFKWSGDVTSSLTNLGTLYRSEDSNPESLLAYGATQRIQVLNDEGSRKLGGEKCKDVSKESKSFSDSWYVVE
jgi:hypothetical protein